MNESLYIPSSTSVKIATLVDHKREGLFVFAFCPICDHAEESRDEGTGRDGAKSSSIAKIQVHISKAHRPKPVKIKVAKTRGSLTEGN